MHLKKDASTLQYVTRISQRTPLVPLSLVLDLGGGFLWVDCDHYVSSTYRSPRCRSSQCYHGCGDCYDAPKPGCNNHTCLNTPANSLTGVSSPGEITSDVVSVQSTDGSNPGRVVSVPNFLFSCSSAFLLEGLAAGATGMAGLGRSKISLSSQFAAAFSFNRKFAICLASSTSSNGAVFFGSGPYVLLPNVDASQSLAYTPLLNNPVSTAPTFFSGSASVEYFIGVKSIKVNGKTVSLNATKLVIDGKSGVGGTKISTVKPYTVLEDSIFKAVTAAFVREAAARKISRAAAVAPFEVCFSKKNMLSTRLGWSVPTIELVMQNQNVVWTVYGANSMVDVSETVSCLGFVNGGSDPTTSVVLGGHQLENILLQFDLASSRLGFSSTLLGRQTTCANFNFTSTA